MARYAFLQINPTVGDLEGNTHKVLAFLQKAEAYSPDLVLTPELAITGYPPEDLLLRPSFLQACLRVLEAIAPQIQIPTLLGFPSVDEEGRCHNSAALIEKGQVVAVYHKCLLPNYAVFDEKRYFDPGEEGLLIQLGEERAGVVICEDAWEETGPARDEAIAGATVILCLSASPFHRGKTRLREDIFSRLCKSLGVAFLYCNLVGGQDELVFDGGSFAMDAKGRVIARARSFEEDLFIVDLPPQRLPRRPSLALSSSRPVKLVVLARATEERSHRPPLSSRPKERACLALLEPDEEIYAALVLGVRDYLAKNRFAGALVGLSGGVDSALTATIAVDALGKDRVIGVTMPSRYTSSETLSDAEKIAKNLGIRLINLPIEAPYQAFRQMLDPILQAFEGDPENLTDQNLQARIRAVYLMALSNRLGYLVLNTSNKSECAVGYGTLYGDMIGGYAVLKDVFKTHVWRLARYVNRRAEWERIPLSTIERIPTAELRPNQEDRQSIPDYPLLDPILELYIEEDRSAEEIVAAGHDPALVARVIHLVDAAEFKRRQAVLGTRVTPKAFGKDRRLPVTNRFQEGSFWLSLLPTLENELARLGVDSNLNYPKKREPVDPPDEEESL